MTAAPLRSCRELVERIYQIGALPLFRGDIPGFSVEEMTPAELWFQDGVEGPWDWREQIAEAGEIAYAKLFHAKAGFVSPELYPDFCNLRRQGYDFDARAEDGLVRDVEKRLYRLISEGHTLSSDLRRLFGAKGFEGAMNALEMNTYVTVRRFERRVNRLGVPYGWSVTRYALSEDIFGDRCSAAYCREPDESLRYLQERLRPFLKEEEAHLLLCA